MPDPTPFRLPELQKLAPAAMQVGISGSLEPYFHLHTRL